MSNIIIWHKASGLRLAARRDPALATVQERHGGRSTYYVTRLRHAGESGVSRRRQVGGRLGSAFDEDPKRWRMLSEALASGGMALELATAFAPRSAFLLLAGVPARPPIRQRDLGRRRLLH